MRPYGFLYLPCHDFINYLSLLGSGAAEIDTCGFNAFVPHEVGKQGDVIELVEEVLGKAMAERVRIDHFSIKAILISKMF